MKCQRFISDNGSMIESNQLFVKCSANSRISQEDIVHSNTVPNISFKYEHIMTAMLNSIFFAHLINCLHLEQSEWHSIRRCKLSAFACYRNSIRKPVAFII